MIKEPFGDNALGQMQIYEWCRWLQKVWQIQSNVKSTLIGFIDTEGVMHKEFVPPGQLVNGKFYCAVLRRSRENIQRKRPDKLHNKSWTLHHGYDLASTNTTVIPHPPYSPHLTPCNFFLFPKMKLKLKGQRFNGIQEIRIESQDVMKTLKRNDFQQCFWSRKSHWDHLINAEGDYIKGDGGE